MKYHPMLSNINAMPGYTKTKHCTAPSLGHIHGAFDNPSSYVRYINTSGLLENLNCD